MSFHTEAALLQAISTAPSLAEQGRLTAELQALRSARTAQVAEDRSLEWADAVISETLSPVPTHIFHTAATDWLDEVAPAPSENAHQEMMAEAAVWFGRTSAFVKSDDEEFAEQAMGRARFLAGKYGEAAPEAARAFMDYVAFLHQREAASGLDQIEQTIDPNNSPKTTPLPDGTFDNFAPPVNEFNNGVDEGQSSWNAETVNDMINGSGGADLSGGGSGTAGGTMSPGGGKPSEHDTGNAAPEVPPVSIGGGGEFGPKNASREDRDDVAPFGLTSLAMQYVANLDDFQEIFAAEAQARETKTAAFKACALCAKGSCDSCSSCPGRGSCHMTSGDVEHGSGTEGGHGAFAAHGYKGEVVQTYVRNPKVGKQCQPCYMGNHTGTNGTQGCRGKWCSCDGKGCGKQSNTDTGGKSRETFDAENKKEGAAAEGWYTTENGKPTWHEPSKPDPSHERYKQVFPDGVPLHGDLTEEQQAELKRRGSYHEGASTLDQIQQTTAPDGVTNKPTPLPGEVMWPVEPEWAEEQSTGAPGAPDSPSQEHSTTNASRKQADMFGNSDEPHAVPGHQRPGYNEEHNVGPKAGEADDGGEKDTPGSMTQDFSNDNTHDFNVKATADYQKAYRFAQKWTPDMVLVTTGSPEFETGIFEGLTDANRAAFLAKHVEQVKDFPVLGERLIAHASLAAHLAGTDTDLATTAPGSFPDQGGKTPINGPGTTPILDGGKDPAAAGGPAPYNGADPQGHSVVPGADQTPKAPHPGEHQPPARMDHGVDLTAMTPQTLAFRKTVQARLLAEANEK